MNLLIAQAPALSRDLGYRSRLYLGLDLDLDLGSISVLSPQFSETYTKNMENAEVSHLL